MKNKEKPEEGKIYALTGGHDTPSIANGNTWAESEVKKRTFSLNGGSKFEHLFDFMNKMESLGFKRSGVNRNPAHRIELQNLPTFSGLAGPMYDGPNKIRYETWETYEAMSR